MTFTHLTEMQATKLLILSLALLISSSASAQNTMGSALGEYTVHSIPIDRDSIDSVRNLYPIRRVDPIIFVEFSSSQTLKLKWNRRFKLTDSRPITAIGFNTDNPTIYGSYQIKNDTLILKYQYAIQHFNKIAKKRRVKTKFTQTNQSAPIKRFARIDKDTFKIYPNGRWIRKQ